MIPSLETFKSPKSPQLLGRKPLNILEPSPTVRVPGSSPRFAVPLQRAAERPRRSAAAQRGGRAAGGASHGAAGAAGRGAGRPHRARPGGLGGLMLSTGSREMLKNRRCCGFSLKIVLKTSLEKSLQNRSTGCFKYVQILWELDLVCFF